LLDNSTSSKKSAAFACYQDVQSSAAFPGRKLDLTFEPIVNYATISAIEVIDESE